MSKYGMKKSERASARERCETADAGPWTWDITKEEVGSSDGMVACQVWRRNGRFIAHARTDLPKALDAIDDLVGFLQTIHQMVRDDEAKADVLNEIECALKECGESVERGEQ